jgi:hypothetical protein
MAITQRVARSALAEAIAAAAHLCASRPKVSTPSITYEGRDHGKWRPTQGWLDDRYLVCYAC